MTLVLTFPSATAHSKSVTAFTVVDFFLDDQFIFVIVIILFISSVSLLDNVPDIFVFYNFIPYHYCPYRDSETLLEILFHYVSRWDFKKLSFSTDMMSKNVRYPNVCRYFFVHFNRKRSYLL